LREFVSQGITLTGRLQSVQEGVLHFAEDLAESLAYGDAAYNDFLDKVDSYIAQQGMDLPAEAEARAKYPDPPCVSQPLRRLDIRRIGLSAVIWATGYKFDFGWIDQPRHKHGIAPLPGIYFLGLPWLRKMSSSFLSGVADDAAYLADSIRPSGE
jgi:putative flavoprotein involved in K+ transport